MTGQEVVIKNSGPFDEHTLIIPNTIRYIVRNRYRMRGDK